MSKVTFGPEPEPVAGITMVDWAHGMSGRPMIHIPIENHPPIDFNNDPVVIYGRCAMGIVVKHLSVKDEMELPKCSGCFTGVSRE